MISNRKRITKSSKQNVVNNKTHHKKTKVNNKIKKVKFCQSIEDVNNTIPTICETYNSPPPGLCYIPIDVFQSIMNSFEKELDKFKRDFNCFMKSNDIIYTNVLDWFEVEKFIHNYVQKLVMNENIDKFISEYGIIQGMVLLIQYYKNILYKDVFENESEIIHYINNNHSNTKYDIAYSIISKMTGHCSYDEITGF